MNRLISCVLAFLWLAHPPGAWAFDTTGFPASTVNLSVTTSSSRVAIPSSTASNGGAVRIVNSGAVTVFVRLGNSSITATTTTDMPILPGAAEAVEFVSADGAPVFVAAITANSTATVYVTRGSGSVAGFGGGSSTTSDVATTSLANIESYTNAQAQTVNTNRTRVQIQDENGNDVSWGPPDAGDLAPTGGGAGSAVSVTTSSTTVWLATDTTVREMFVTAQPTNTSYILCGIAAEAVTDTVFSHVLYPSQTLDTGMDGSVTEIRCKAPTGAATQSVAVAKLTGE